MNYLSTKLKAEQKLFISTKMKLTLKVLSLPAVELKHFIEKEVEKNPLLETSCSFTEDLLLDENRKIKLSSYERDFFSSKSIHKKDPFACLYKQKSLYEHLMEQAREKFLKKDLEIVKWLIANLSKQGFLDIDFSQFSEKFNISKIKLLKIIKALQSCDPIGIFAKDFRQCLLLQLIHKKRQNSFFYKIINEHFDDFKNGKIKNLSKSLKIPQEKIKKLIEENTQILYLNPIAQYTDEPTFKISIDASIKHEKNKWTITIQEDEIPIVNLKEKYLKLLDTPISEEEKKFIKASALNGKYLIEAIENRKKILTKILICILYHQKSFFLNLCDLAPLSMQTIAEELNVHYSTVVRAINDKYIDSPIGIIKLKDLFSKALNNDKKLSKQKVLNLLNQIIKEEDKKKPLSDEKIIEKLQKKGVLCKRRTIAKYRKKLFIAPASKRKKI